MCWPTGHSLRYLPCLVEVLFQLMSTCQGSDEAGVDTEDRRTSSISAVSSSMLEVARQYRPKNAEIQPEHGASPLATTATATRATGSTLSDKRASNQSLIPYC